MLETRIPFVAMIAPWYARLHERPLQLRVIRWLDSSPFYLWTRLVGLHTIRVARYFLANFGSLPASAYVSVKYEDLCREPDVTMNRILEFVGVVPAQPVSWKSRIQPRQPKVLPEVARQYRRLLNRLRPYLEFHRYEPEPAKLREAS